VALIRRLITKHRICRQTLEFWWVLKKRSGSSERAPGLSRGSRMVTLMTTPLYTARSGCRSTATSRKWLKEETSRHLKH